MIIDITYSLVAISRPLVENNKLLIYFSDHVPAFGKTESTNARVRGPAINYIGKL